MRVTNKVFDYDFTIKSANDQTRVITAVCSSKSLDRQGDTVDITTAKWGRNIPLLINHKLDEGAVGYVTSLVVRGNDLIMTATIPTIEAECETKNALLDVWQRVKHGLLSAVSIGFTAKNAERIETGFAYSDISIHEISLCNIGANQDALVLSTSNAKTLQATAKPPTQPKHVTVSLNVPTTGVSIGKAATPKIYNTADLPKHLILAAAKSAHLPIAKRLNISHSISANYDQATAKKWLSLVTELKGHRA